MLQKKQMLIVFYERHVVLYLHLMTKVLFVWQEGRPRPRMLRPWPATLTLVCLLTLAESQIRVGGAINIFGRYGYLSISMKVVPRNDSDQSWLFREPIVDVFKNVPVRNRYGSMTPETMNNIKFGSVYYWNLHIANLIIEKKILLLSYPILFCFYQPPALQTLAY